MPEYLSPGVYVEEVDTGAKPIEGVSTSTAGMVGVTERGPVDVPILVTSVGEFERWFGGKLDRTAYANGTDRHCYLPDSVEGFFANGGKRAYITRVVPSGALRASFMLHALNPNPAAVSAATTLLRNAAPGSGDADDPLVVLDGGNITAPGDVLRVGDGSSAEYRGAAPLTPTTLTDPEIVMLTQPSPSTVAAGGTIGLPSPLGGPAFTVDVDTAAGSTSVAVVAAAAPGTPPAAGMVVRIGGSLASIVTATPDPAAATDFTLRIDPPLATSAAAGDAVDILVARVGLAMTLDAIINIGDTAATIVAATDVGSNAPAIGDAITVDGETLTLTGVTPDAANPATTFDVTFPAATALHNAGVPVQTAPPGLTLTLEATAGSLALVASTTTPPAAGTVLFVPNGGGGGAPRLVAAPSTIALGAPLGTTVAAGAEVRLVTIGAPVPPLTLASRPTTAAAAAADGAILLGTRRELRVGQLLEIGGPTVEHRHIRALPASSPIGNDPGMVLLDVPLSAAHAQGASVDVVVATPTADAASTVLAAAAAGGSSLSITGSLAAGDIVSIDGPDGETIATVASATAITPAFVALDAVLQGAHRAGEPLLERVPLLEVSALDAGQWGNRLRVAIQDETVGLVAPTTLRERVDATHIRLTSSVGVEPGTVLELSGTDGGPTDALLKVVSIDRQDNDKITLAAPLTGQQQAQITAAGANLLRVRSREFRLVVELLHQRDAARPRRNELVIASEVFANLSMDPRHSRYVQRLIGDSAPGAPIRLIDRRSHGESLYVRVHDAAAADPPSPAQLSVRVGPEALVDVSPIGVRRAARHALGGGDDLISTIDDGTYIGADNVVPELRTGLQSLRNVDPISIIACPGRTSVRLQSALINHCEQLRYRFAVLDCGGAPDDTIADVQSQRQNYDTKYAALYYPWLMVPQVFPANAASVDDEPIPPSGHVVGLYARIDIERGVHKAPANEVVRGGIVDLRRALNKSEHDILNPYPTNINVIRDLRHESLGIRVYGARVITSDPDWKYVNVRRLLIFIEKSIDIGLQWVVFEPNAEPLWARVRRSVSNFLTTVWRNGALEGLSREEAFFVKCDRTTMTQADIDNGRLIIEVGVAPVKPAEFVIVRIGLFTAHGDD